MREPFLLKWSLTWPDKPNDFTGRDPGDRLSFARVYRQTATPDPARTWAWFVTIDQERVASGHERDGAEEEGRGPASRARPAVRAAERAWEETKERLANARVRNVPK